MHNIAARDFEKLKIIYSLVMNRSNNCFSINMRIVKQSIQIREQPIASFHSLTCRLGNVLS